MLPLKVNDFPERVPSVTLESQRLFRTRAFLVLGIPTPESRDWENLRLLESPVLPQSPSLFVDTQVQHPLEY